MSAAGVGCYEPGPDSESPRAQRILPGSLWRPTPGADPPPRPSAFGTALASFVRRWGGRGCPGGRGGRQLEEVHLRAASAAAAEL